MVALAVVGPVLDLLLPHGARDTFVDCVLSSTHRPLCAQLAAADASAASALGFVAAFVRAAAFSHAAGSPYRRRLALPLRWSILLMKTNGMGV